MSREADAARRLAARTWVALVHHPVKNRAGEIVTTAVTNLDIHDIARACRTYGLAGYFIVTPVERQRHLVRRILAHWQPPHGDGPNRLRREALERARVVPDLDGALAVVQQEAGARPQLVATSAQPGPGTLSDRVWSAGQIDDLRPVILLFGTGWGLAAAALERADVRLAPLKGPTEYNHLSVRCAVAILLDRLFGMRSQ